MSTVPRDIVIVDDLAATRSWLRQAMLRAFPQAVIREGETLAGARQLCAAARPGLALIDLRLPDGNGIALIRELHAAAPQALTVVPSIFDDDGYLFEALCAGASGYVLKDQAIPLLADTLAAIVAGRPPLSASLARRILRHADSGALALAAEQQSLLLGRARGLAPDEAAARAGLDDHGAATAMRAIYASLR